jgi:hypothetical protein
MWDLYVVFRLVPYVFSFLSEQCTRFFSRNWPTIQATVEGGSVEGQVFPYTATLRYQYRVGTAMFDGFLTRKCLRRRSAEELGNQKPGTTLDVRFKPEGPERSYAPLPLAWGGFTVGALPVFGLAAFISFLVYAVIEERYNEAHYAIPSTEWHVFEVPTAFQLQIPGPATPTSSLFANLDVGGKEPSAMAWSVEHNGAYFYAGILEYPAGANVTSEMFDRVLAYVKAENSKRYVYQDERITLQGRTGREFKFTRPYTTLRVFVDRQRLYVIATNWYIQSDTRKFFDSLHMSE